MNETLQNALAEIITSALQNAAQAKDFILSEMPDVVQQLLWWKAAESIAYCLLSLTMFVSVILYWRWAWRHRNADWIGDAIGPIFGGGGMVSVVIIGAGSVSFSLTWLQILIAPKVYLIEYAADLVR